MSTDNKKAEEEAFWKLAGEVRTKMEAWPEWKRNIRITKYSTEFDKSQSLPAGRSDSQKRKC